MIDVDVLRMPNGARWSPAKVAAELVSVPLAYIHVWVQRGAVRSAGVDGARWVCLDDVEDAAAARLADGRVRAKERRLAGAVAGANDTAVIPSP